MKTTNKIGDFGQKIGGARKDLIRENIEILSQITDDVLLVQPLSKVYRLPALRSLFLSGAISGNQARMCWFAWNQLTAKPKIYGVQHWVKETRIILQIIQEILSGDRIALDGVFTPNITNDHISLFLSEMEAANWPEEEYSRGSYSVKLTPRYISEKPYAVNDGKHYRAYHLTMPEAVADIRRRVAASYGTSEKSLALEIRYWTSSKEYFICPKAKPDIVLRRGLKDSGEARRVRNEEADELRAEYERLRTIPEVRDNDTKLIRLGEDYRAGQNLTPEAFASKFPFRGVEFGNWVNQEERVECLNRCADALCDLAKIIGLRAKALTHGQQLALAFGSRGIAKASAHYESGKRVINLTKQNGAGCLAHEWWHSLDNMMMHADGNPMLFSVSGCMKLKNKNLMQVAFDLNKALEQSAFAIRSRRVDTYKGHKYWGDMTELSARAFEAYVFYKLEASDMRNDYLVSFKPMSDYQRPELYPYPTRDEAEKFEPLFDAYIDVAFGEAEKIHSIQPETIEIEKKEPEVGSPEKPAYGMGEKSQLFPLDLVAFQKYFAKVEEFCRDRSIEYFFIRESDVKVRLVISMTSGDTMAFDYDTVSRHRDAFTLPADGSTRRRIQNWTVALSQMEAFPVAASYGVCEKSPNTPEEVQLPEEDKEGVKEADNQNEFCENKNNELPTTNSDTMKNTIILSEKNCHRAKTVKLLNDPTGCVWDWHFRGKRIRESFLHVEFSHFATKQEFPEEEIIVGDHKKELEKWEVLSWEYELNFENLWDAAVRSFHGTSFSPEERAALYIRDYEAALISDLANIPQEEQPRYIDKFTNWVRVLFDKHSRCLSAMITGPARFPTRRNEKANNSYESAVKEFGEWREKVQKAIARRIEEAKPAEQKICEEWVQLKRSIHSSASTIKGINEGTEKCYSKALFVNSIYGKVETYAKRGEVEIVEKAVEYVRLLNKETSVITERHKFFKLIDEAKVVKERQEIKANKEDVELLFDGGRVIKNFSEDRLQILFDGKPASDVISKLKHNGFRWSPRFMAWQRQLTDNAYYGAARVIPVTVEQLRSMKQSQNPPYGLCELSLLSVGPQTWTIRIINYFIGINLSVVVKNCIFVVALIFVGNQTMTFYNKEMVRQND